jgi:chromosome partitioning protein
MLLKRTAEGINLKDFTMPQIITVTNRKGGVGKTTLVVHVAAGLATMGYNVGVVDTDSQGHVALMFGLEQENDLFDILINKMPLHEKVIVVPKEIYSAPDRPSEGNLYMIRGYDKTFKIPHEMHPTDTFLFYDTMMQFTELANLDFIIIDSQPTMSQFDGAVYLSTDAFLYVTECEMLAITGLIEAIRQMEKFNGMRKKFLNMETRILGIVPNKMRTNTVLNQHNISILAKEFGMFHKGGLVMSPMRMLTVWGQACNDRVPMFTYEPSGEAANDAWRIVHNVLERLNEWQIIAGE